MVLFRVRSMAQTSNEAIPSEDGGGNAEGEEDEEIILDDFEKK
jgi:hypothetical protein